jgi:hypothetical protein
MRGALSGLLRAAKKKEPVCRAVIKIKITQGNAEVKHKPVTLIGS